MLEKILLGGWNLIRGKLIWMLLIFAILLIPLGYGASKIKSEAPVEGNFRKGSSTYKALVKLKNTFSDQAVVIVLKGDNVAEICSDQNLAAMKRVQDEVYALSPKVLSVLTPEFFLSMLKTMGQVPADATPESVIIDPQTGDITPTFKNSAFFNPQNAVINIALWKSWNSDQTHDFIEEVNAIVKDAGFDSNVQPIVSGFPVLIDYMATEMPKTLARLMGIIVVLMLLVLAFGFRTRGKVFRRWLSLGLVGISVIYTMGITGFLDIPITNVSMAAFPILLGLGVDYAIQFHNRYDEESRKGASANEGVTTTLRRTGPPIIMAMTLCMIGFASVFVVDNQLIFYFGTTMIVGIAVCMLVALFLLLGILYLRDKPHDATRKPAPRGIGPLEKIMGFIAPMSVKWAPALIIVSIICAGFGWYYEHNLKTNTGWDGSVRDGVQEFKDVKYVRSLAGGLSPLDVVIEADNVLEPEVLNWAQAQSNELVAKEGIEVGGYVGMIASLPQLFESSFGGIPATAADAADMIQILPKPIWISMIKEDHTALHITVLNSSDANAPIQQTMDGMEAAFADPPPGVKATVTGLSILSPGMSDALDQSRRVIMGLGVGLILVVLLLMFKLNIKRAFAAAFPVLLVLGWSALFLKVTGIKVSVIMGLLPAQVMAIGIEFTILLLMRYYEERDKGEEPMVAMTTAMTRIGRAILVSGGMVIIGFLVMLFAFNFPFMQEFGLVTMFDTVLILVSTLVVLPALVVRFDIGKGKAKARAQKPNP